MFVIDAAGGEPRQLTNRGLSPAPVEAPDRTPAGFVPPPFGRAGMRWDGDGIRYPSARSAWRINPATGSVVEEAVP